LSDNVIRPDQWVANGIVSLAPVQQSSPPTEAVAGGGGGPHDPGMEARVGKIEASLERIEPLLVRIEERTSHLATQAELGRLAQDLNARMSDLKIEERTNHVATQAEVGRLAQDLSTRISDLKLDMASKATRGTVWTVGLALAGLVVASLAAGGVYMPYLATLLRRAG
jgi:hypothetical protein